MNRTARAGALVAATLTLLSACVSTNATVLNKSLARPPIPKDSVVIYSTADRVPRKYEEVAILNSSGDAGMTNEQEMYESMRKEAAKLGANGVILGATKDPGTGAKLANAFFGTGADRKGKAVAIYVFPADATATADTTKK